MRIGLVTALIAAAFFVSGCFASFPVKTVSTDTNYENVKRLVEENNGYVDADEDMPQFAKDAKKTRNNEALKLAEELRDIVRESAGSDDSSVADLVVESLDDPEEETSEEETSEEPETATTE